MRTIRWLVLAALVVAAWGCLESNPQPMPEQDTASKPGQEADAMVAGYAVDSDLIFASSPDKDEGVVIVGDAGAAPGAEAAYASEEAGEKEGGEGGEDNGGSGVSGDGSFVIVVPKVKVPKVVLKFRYPDTDEVVEVEVPIPVPGTAEEDGDRPWMANADMSGDPEGGAGPPAEYNGFAGKGGGTIEVTLSGENEVTVAGAPFSATPMAAVVVVNLSTQDKKVTQADNIGQFLAVLPGQPGDTLSMFAVNPGDHSKATSALAIVVAE